MGLKFRLGDGKIKFVTHKVEWQETRKQFDVTTNKMVDVVEDKFRECYSGGQKDAFVTKLSEKSITPTIALLEQPSAELLASCDGKVFSNYDDAVSFVNGDPIPKTELQILQETVDALLIASLLGATVTTDGTTKKTVIGAFDKLPVVYLRFIHKKQDGGTLIVNMYRAQADGKLDFKFDSEKPTTINYEFMALASSTGNYVEINETFPEEA